MKLLLGLEAEHDPRMRESDFGDQRLKAVAVLGVGAGNALIRIDRMDMVDWTV